MLAALSRAPQLLVKKLCSGLIPFYPCAPEQEVMDLVRENDLLDVNVLAAQALNQVSGLGERNVAVIIAMHEKHRRLPRCRRRHGRRIERQLLRFFGVRRIAATSAEKR